MERDSIAKNTTETVTLSLTFDEGDIAAIRKLASRMRMPLEQYCSSRVSMCLASDADEVFGSDSPEYRDILGLLRINGKRTSDVGGAALEELVGAPENTATAKTS